MSDNIPHARGPITDASDDPGFDADADDVELEEAVTSADLARIAADRKQLWANGYPPVALLSHTDPHPKEAGKRPIRKGWVSDARRSPPVDAIPDKALAIAMNTGISCHGLRFVDIDCGDRDHADAIQEAAEDTLGITIVRRRSNSFRRGMLYRAADGEPPKRKLKGTTYSDSTEPDAVEVLGNGQQFVALGTHATGAEIYWTVSPLDLPRDQLPAITEEQISEFLAIVATIIGGTACEPRRINGHDHAPIAPERLPAELARAHAALMKHVPSDDREEWIEIGAGLYHTTSGSEDGMAIFDEWSAKSAKYVREEIAGIWDSFERDDGQGQNAGLGKIFHIAKRHGWQQSNPRNTDDATVEAEARGARGHQPHSDHTPNRVFIRRTSLRDETDIPTRPWLAPGFLLRRAVTLIFGPPDQGKSLLLVAWAVALALGRTWGTFAPNHRLKVLTILAEEDDDEQNARFAASLRTFGATPANVQPYLLRLVVPDLATLLEVDPNTQALKPTKGWQDLVHEVEQFRPDVVIADPLIEFHTAEENDNTKLKAVIGWFRALARMFDLAVTLSHHSRKGELVPGSLEMSRGASATGGAVRLAYTFLEALDADVERFGIEPRHRRLFCRLDRARASQAPPSVNDADWFEKQPRVLDNGDATPALVPWTPPAAVAPDQSGLIRLLLDIAKGYVPTGSMAAQGDPWSPQLRDTEPRSVRALFRLHGITKQSEAATLKAIKGDGVHEADYRVPRRSNARKGLRTADGLPKAAWTDREDGDA